ncbi:MAG: DUF4080 domain-containing protein [Rikenellaceae bacterium]
MKQNKRLVWLDINSSYSHSSLALPAIEACRCGDEYEWSRVSGTINSDLYPLTRELYETEPDLVAATLWLFNHEVVVAICERIKVLLPNVQIILGGPEFNGDNELFLRRNSFVDFVFRGEGEVEFQRFLRGDDPAYITGLCYLDGATYHDNGAAKVANFADIPTPERSEFCNYSSPFVQLESSRGCFNSCAFCVSGGDRPIRNRSIEDVKERIEQTLKHGVKDIRVLDRTFNYSASRAREMLQLFTHYPQMNFHLEIHPALLTDELCELLSSMPKGLLHLEAGMQSLDDRVIEACERIGTNEAALKGLRKLCRMENFETHTDLIAGLPHYTLEQIFSDLRDLSMLSAGEIQLELLKLLHGTKMRREAQNLGIKYNPKPPYEVLQTPAISVVELDRARLLSKLIDKFYNAKGWQFITRKMINDSPDFLPNFLDYLTATELLEKPIGLAKCGSLLFDFAKGWRGGEYLDDISLAWIENGLSHRSEEAGTISKATTLPDSMIREHNVHYYLWQGHKRQFIISFDRSKEHSRPSQMVELEPLPEDIG